MVWSSLPLFALTLACAPGRGVSGVAPTAGDAPDSSSAAEDSASDSSSAVEDSGSDTAPDSGVDSGTGDTVADLGTLSAPLVLYAVRHAEKASEGDDPGLTEEGQARAEALADLLTDVPITAIYATDLRRTQETVAPTADDHGLPVIVDYDPEVELALHIVATDGGGTALHAGHSYTLPDLFAALGLDPVPVVSGYGQLWTITLAPDGAPVVEESRFGE